MSIRRQGILACLRRVRTGMKKMHSIMEYQRSDDRRVEGLVTIGSPGERVWVVWAGMSIEVLKLADGKWGRRRWAMQRKYE